MKKIFPDMLLIAVAIFISIGTQAQVKNIVLVHGAFADVSGWKKEYTILKAHGYNVSVVGNPNTGLDDDVAATKRMLDSRKVLLSW